MVALLQTQTKLALLSETDPLTGVGNRRRFDDALALLWRRHAASPAPFALLLADVDRFKRFNDHHGHPAGDACLRLVAATLQRELGKAQDLLARYGGEEFAVLLPGHNLMEAEAVACRLCRAVEASGQAHGYSGDGKDLVTISIGVAAVMRHSTAEEVVKTADQALYEAKRRGRNRVVARVNFDSDAVVAVAANALSAAEPLEAALRRALALGHIDVHYQPQYSCDGLRLVGFEALLRWTDSARGSVSPTEFIAVAERSGLIDDLGAFVLREACLEASRWPAPIRVAVNVSPLQLRSTGLVRLVADILSETGLAPERLELELTESALFERTDVARETLVALSRCGVRLSLDDVGTGYSSLTRLCALPFDIVKIDRVFLDTTAWGGRGLAILKSIVDLAHALGMQAVAEGVETPEQLDLIRGFGCDLAQGYLLGRPEPLARLGDLVEADFGLGRSRPAAAQPALTRG